MTDVLDRIRDQVDRWAGGADPVPFVVNSEHDGILYLVLRLGTIAETRSTGRFEVDLDAEGIVLALRMYGRLTRLYAHELAQLAHVAGRKAL